MCSVLHVSNEIRRAPWPKGVSDDQHWSYWLFLPPSPPGPSRSKTTRVGDGRVGPCFDHGPSRCSAGWRETTVTPIDVIYYIRPLVWRKNGAMLGANLEKPLAGTRFFGSSIVGTASGPKTFAVIVQYAF